MNVYSSYTRSSINLAKAKSDYEYVYNKVKLFESSNNKKILAVRSIIGNLILKNNLEGKIDNLNIFC